MTLEQQTRLKDFNANKLRPMIMTIFRQMARDTKAKYAATGDLINANDYIQEFDAAIRQRIRIVANEFKREYRRSISQDKKNIDDDVNNNINELIISLSESNTALITETNQKHLEELLQQSIEELREQGAIVTNEVVADLLAKKIIRVGVPRSDLIAEMVVQQAAEGAKETEVSTLMNNGFIAGLINEGQIEEEPKRTWNTILDRREREAHHLADGQVRGISEPFLVDNEFLKYPGDPEGSPNNIIRCRCGVTYE